MLLGGWRISDSIGEILNGLRCYFDKALPAMLLYKSERQQYQEAIAEHVSPSTLYGAEQLLRLFGMLIFDAKWITCWVKKWALLPLFTMLNNAMAFYMLVIFNIQILSTLLFVDVLILLGSLINVV